MVVNANPAAPTNVTATPSSICSGQATTLSATASAGNQVFWYDAQTNGNLLNVIYVGTSDADHAGMPTVNSYKEKYIKTYKKFGGSSISTTDAEQFNKFFTF